MVVPYFRQTALDAVRLGFFDKHRRQYPFRHMRANDVACQDTVLHTVGNGTYQSVAITRHETCMERDTERRTEERTHREPVGDTADERTFEHRLQRKEPDRVANSAHQEK